ncbi:AAA domain-containing protein [Tenacibaculum finnmarkense]|uniref:McrB family protein n=1 Tax=Tenacibaculum finnmarkense TaxID=2781243 RepID=UPI001EFBA65D|nr:AAA family ATPase [Tenacibaculum finnmarkense]MCG8807444.1 AAA domain-containing protein [Tenacibaculum finnmarkense]MCG8817663.1 AAA domain-containing protein [Tenacibaculum finnmarkense]
MKLKEVIDNLDVWDNWVNSYKNYVPKFIEEASTKLNWEEWNPVVFKEYFEKSNNQCVSSLQQGYFTKDEQTKIKNNWSELAPLLKIVADNQKEPQWDTYQQIKSVIRSFTTQNRKAATYRLIAGLQPNILCTIVKDDSLKNLFKFINNNIEEALPKYQHNWFKDSNAINAFYKKHNPSKNYMDLISYPWQSFEYFKNPNSINENNQTKDSSSVMKEYIDLLHHKKQIILQGPPGTGKTRLAKQIASEMTISENNFKVIQFHPSYTYEDFVRGISVKNNQDGNIEYKTENKVLAKIAKEALKNYTDSQKETESLSKEVNLKEYFTLFVDFIEDKIEENNGFFKLTDNVGLLSSDEDAFRYKGKNDGWTKNGNRMLFKDILQAFTDENTVRQDLKKNPNLSGLAKQHASYFVRILNMFQEFFKDEKLTFENTSVEKVALKNYVLIIDEINRANLSSVLGELIYALEYRGEAVESMYDIDGNRKITLPPNLYIIGTMNTADRSVGQIDYAIRRRFAFIDVLPEILEESTLENDLKFNTDSFNEVEALFVGDNNHLSDEFKAKDVQLGHSYFIYKEANFDMNLKYEIKPILQEYVADGILKESALELIEALKSHL